MKLTTERKPGSILELNITADDAEYQKAIDDAISRQSRNVQIPGFRKGKAPRHMVERFYGGREVFAQDAAEKLMDKLYREALEQEEVNPVGDPELTSMELDPSLVFVVAVPVYPEIELGDYTAVRVDPVDAAVTDEDVEEVITRLIRQQGTWKDVEGRKPIEGDQVTIDYTVHEGEEEFQEPVEDAVWVIGETNLLEQLKERIEELEPGETGEFEIFFEEDDESADPSVRGKQLKYNVTLKGLKERELPELTDELAKEIGDVETVAALREQIFEEIHQGKTGDGRNEVLNKIVEAVGADTTIDLPEAMIEEEIEHQLSHRKQDLQRQGINWDQMVSAGIINEETFKAELRPDATQRLTNTLILQEIARRENIEISDEDVDAEIEKIAGPMPEGDDAEAVERANRMREVYNGDYFRNVLKNDLYERTLTDRIIDIATEGQGAVLNGWVPTESSEESEAASETKPTKSSKMPQDGEGVDWVPGDGGYDIPDGFPIKGNASSKIYHPEESPNYSTTIAEIYFANGEVAEAHGYRLPKTLEKAAAEAGEAAADAVADLIKGDDN
ncbi:MAG: trigger factor [Thermomicrobiales bacterium]|nr:trigger factor [Thermomicrobiales bacterium]